MASKSSLPNSISFLPPFRHVHTSAGVKPSARAAHRFVRLSRKESAHCEKAIDAGLAKYHGVQLSTLLEFRGGEVVLLRCVTKLLYIPIYPSHRVLAERYAASVAHHLPAGTTTEQLTPESQMCAIILLELVVLRQYLKLDPSADAELYEASRVLTDREYDELDDGEHALRARVVREPTIHEQAFQSTAPNFSGMREHRWDEDAGSGRDQAKRAHQNASHLFESQGLHLGRKLDRHGTVPVEHPSDLTKVLSEDGSPYVFGTVNHLWKDHMTLFGSLPRRPPSPTSSIPRPFPLATPSKDQVPVKFPSKDGKPVKAKLRIKIPAQSKGPSSKPIVASKVEGKKSKVQSTLSFAPRILRMATMEKRTHSRRESKDSEEQDGMGTPTVKKAKTG